MSILRAARLSALHSPARPSGRVVRGLVATALLIGGSELQAQATPAGTKIHSTAVVTYIDIQRRLVTIYASDDGSAEMVVGQVGGIELDQPGASTTDPGSTVTFRHTLRNIGNGLDSVTIGAQSRSGWTVRVYRDLNGNGIIDADDPLVLAPIVLAQEETKALLVSVAVPSLPSLRGTTDTIRITGTSQFNSNATDLVMDQLQIRSAGIVIALDKSVDRSSATVGDVLTYTLTYHATGTSSATNARISDVIPVGSKYVPGTLRLNGAALTDAPGDDRGTFDAATNRVLVTFPTIAGGDSGIVTFQVRVGS